MHPSIWSNEWFSSMRSTTCSKGSAMKMAGMVASPSGARNAILQRASARNNPCSRGEGMPGMVLQIDHLSKRYSNGVQALDDVSLTIGPGMFGLLGPNGAGKSTLMRTLATLQSADAGTARLGEVDVLNDADATRRVLGYLPQEFGVYPRVPAVEMLD